MPGWGVELTEEQSFGFNSVDNEVNLKEEEEMGSEGRGWLEDSQSLSVGEVDRKVI